ncbi:MAG: FtsX-like permease family protein [Steroidobacteraceae bacterium]
MLDPWNPQPRFYEPQDGAFGMDEEFFLPFTVTIQHQMGSNWFNCHSGFTPGWEGRLQSECIWIQFWVELPDAAAVRAFREFLTNYTADQHKSGRFPWPPLVQLSNVRQWLQAQHIVPDEVRLNAVLALGFLAVCLVNAVGLMLARFAGRSGAYAVRRSLGASRMDIFLQCLTESAVVGRAGRCAGTGLDRAGSRRAARHAETVSAYTGQLTYLDGNLMTLTVVLGVGAALLSGLYPAWRAARATLVWQLKEQ